MQLISIPIKYAATKMSSESIQGRPCALFMATRRYAMVFERPDSFIWQRNQQEEYEKIGTLPKPFRTLLPRLWTRSPFRQPPPYRDIR